jgi:phosphoenolpyruvate carboxykinase (ATP)
MQGATGVGRVDDLSGFEPARLLRNLSRAQLYEEVLGRREGRLAESGALVCATAPHTGRSPLDKFIVCEPSTEPQIWWGSVNRPMSDAAFRHLEGDLAAYLRGRDLFVQDRAAGADPRFSLPVRVVTERAWHSLFARNMLLPPSGTGAAARDAWTIVDAPGFVADPSRHGTRTDVVIAVHFARRLVVIAGTSYAGEIKKAVFTVLNGLLPAENVLPMHCSANAGADGDVALFFGLSGTGKTTLSSATDRDLIGDDEHGWSDQGVFNFEGGCYAKLVRLSREAEPQIHAATARFGAVLENVVLAGESRSPDFDDVSLTENTRGAYPLDFVDGHVPSGQGGHPRAIVMLTADAFGVMPPIARLTPAQAMYHFLSGYTARVAGTERGVTEPAATFSACFGAPFLPLRPAVYASLLGRRIQRHQVPVWLVNTGWTGGPYGTGHRMSIAHTRAIVAAALSGALAEGPSRVEPWFGLAIPRECPGVPAGVLDPRGTWGDPAAYDAQARALAGLFRGNFVAFEADVAPEVIAAGPRVGA